MPMTPAQARTCRLITAVLQPRRRGRVPGWMPRPLPWAQSPAPRKDDDPGTDRLGLPAGPLRGPSSQPPVIQPGEVPGASLRLWS
jgi:hypothetical protein